MNSADTHIFRRSKILKLIGKKQHTTKQIINETKFPIASVYRILQYLLENNKIVPTTKSLHASGLPPRIFKLKRGK